MPAYRVAVLSDIHACLTPLNTVLDAVEQFSPLDAVLVAGDFTYGPNQPATITRLCERGVLAVRGNGDVDLLNFADGKSPVYQQTARQFSLIRWSCANTTVDSLNFLRSLPEQRTLILPGADPIRLVHGSPRDVSEFLDPERVPGRLDEVLRTLPEAVLVFGHTHKALLHTQNGRLAVNPGAVSMAIGLPATAYFAILEWSDALNRWQAQLYHVPYDPDLLIKEFSDSGLLDVSPLGPLLLDSALTGKNAASQYMQRVIELAKASGCGESPYIPDAVWEHAAKMFYPCQLKNEF